MSAIRLARGVHAPRPDRQVRRLLPRSRRRAARERRLGDRHARDPVQPGRAAADDRGHDRLPLQRRRGRRRGGRPLRRGARGDHRRAGGREHGRRPAGAGLPRGAALARRRGRRAARLRRGDHRLPRRARRRAGALRRHAGPDRPGQDRRRRAPARGLRRARRRDGAARAGRATSTRPGRSPETRSPRRPVCPCCGGCASRPSTRSSSAWARAWRPGSRPFGDRPARGRDAHAVLQATSR